MQVSWLFHPWVTGGLSIVSAFASSWLLRSTEPSAALRLLVALMPVPFFFLFIASEVRWIRRADEFHRRVLLDSLAIAFPSAIALAVLVEGLQRAGYLLDVGIGELWPVMGLLWIVVLVIAFARYR